MRHLTLTALLMFIGFDFFALLSLCLRSKLHDLQSLKVNMGEPRGVLT